MNVDPHKHDPGRWGHSFLNLAELFVPCLEAAGARSIVEVGAYAGDLTEFLLEWTARVNGSVTAIDPRPHRSLEALDAAHPELSLIRAPSVEALAAIPMPDAIVLDGDHNWYTVTEELQIVAERSSEGTLPLLLLHDVGWPHGRRDAYYAPEEIPEAARQPIREGGGLFPGDPGTRDGALPYKWPAAREGGPRNGVLTAVEDFVAQRGDLRLAVVPAFFGFGVVWSSQAPWSDAVAAVVEPWDRNPLLERVEADRVLHLAEMHVTDMHLQAARERLAQKEALVREVLESGSFALARRLAGLMPGRGGDFSATELRRALGD